MSLSEPPQGPLGPGTRPPQHPYPNDEQSRLPLPTLPSMSSILNPMGEGQLQSEYIARQSHHSFEMVNQHPLYPAQWDPSFAEQRASLVAETQHVLAVPFGHTQLAQRRQVKKITQRRADHPKDHGRDVRDLANSQNEQRDRFEPHIKPEISSPTTRLESVRSNSSTPTSQMSSQPPRSGSMPISGLLSNDPNPNYQRPPPAYSLRMRQQPVAARACGFGERDRRVIDPPPILQMDVSDPNASPEELKALTQQQYAVVHCTLWDPVNDRDDTAMPGTTDKRQQRRLMGTLVASPFIGKDEFDVDGCFFCFPDLSVRTPGIYSLKFSLVILAPMRMSTGYREPIRDSIKSSTFQVFNAKDFAGMRPSTELTKRLKHQGCLISVKKGNTKANGSHNRDDDDDDDDDAGDDETEPKPKGKRTKH